MKIDWVMKTLSETLFTLNNMKRLSLEQKLSSLVYDGSPWLSLSFYDGKYNVIYNRYTAKSKSLSRALSQISKFIK